VTPLREGGKEKTQKREEELLPALGSKSHLTGIPGFFGLSDSGGGMRPKIPFRFTGEVVAGHGSVGGGGESLSIKTGHCA